MTLFSQFNYGIIMIGLLAATPIIGSQNAAIQSYTSQQASIRIGTSLCDQENIFISERTPLIKQSLETMLGMQLADNQVPRIALCMSGGGFRAMVWTLGALDGAAIPLQSNTKRSIFDYVHTNISQLYAGITNTIEQWLGWQNQTTILPTNDEFAATTLNLINCCTHSACLSGSTWAIAGMEYSRLTPKDYLNQISLRISQDILTNFSMEDLVLELLNKTHQNQPISFIDIYGILLAQKLLSNLGNINPSGIDLGAYAQMASATDTPLPIQTSVIGNEEMTDYQWVEFTPFEVGSSYLQAFVPTWAFGRNFVQGQSTDFAPPQSLGFCMGTWGSAMSIDSKDFFNLLIEPNLGTFSTEFLESQFGKIVAENTGFLSILEQQFSQTSIATNNDILEKRISPSQVFNWAFGINNAPLNTDPTLTLIDGGISCNIPVPPLLRPERSIDIIIILDASAGTLGSELQKAQAYAQKNNLPFPSINYDIINQPCSVHQDTSNPEAPIVIYMPLVGNAGYNNGWDPWAADFTSTYNFVYSADDTELLSGLARYNMSQSMQTIINTIQQWISAQPAA